MVKSATTTKDVAGGTKTAEGHEQHTTATVSPQHEVLVDNEIDPDEEIEIDKTAMNHDFAMNKVILSELNSGELFLQYQPHPHLLQTTVRPKQCLSADEAVNGTTTAR